MELPINQIIYGDCIEIMKKMPSRCIDCIVTDPPYGLGFMGKSWDETLPPKEAFEQMFRVLKSGALAFVISSPRQDVLWRMLQMLEEVGFELKQSFISWIYKAGFPKAYDLSLGIDKKFIREEFVAEHGRKPTKEEMKALLKEKRKIVGKYQYPDDSIRKTTKTLSEMSDKYGGDDRSFQDVIKVTEPFTDLAKKWNGWKSITGLKPALECILMVNKPMSESTIVDNVLRWGTGAVNVDACRIPFKQTDNIIAKNPHTKSKGTESYETHCYGKYNAMDESIDYKKIKGRFPANLLVSDKALVDDQSRYFDLDTWTKHHGFLDVAKASKSERDVGLYELKNFHPTVKPIKLMAYLIELGCHKNGVILDPFVGSGTTCIAAKLLNRKWIGIELNSDYVKIAKERISKTYKISKTLKILTTYKTKVKLSEVFG